MKKVTTESNDKREYKPDSFFDKIISFSLNKRGLIVGLTALIITMGSFVIYNQNIDVLPDLNRPVVTVIAEAHGMAPREVETLVTIPLESSLSGAPGVKKIRSVSKRGVTLLQIEFDWGTDVYINRQVVSEKLVNVQKDLPADIQPLLGTISSIMGEIQLIGLHSENGKISLKELRTLADWTIRKRLLAITGISEVIVMGGEVKEYQIIINREKLSKLDISFESITDNLHNLSINTTGGFLEKNGKEFIIRNIGSIRQNIDKKSD